MKILFFSDIHHSNYSQFATVLPNGRNSRFQDTLLAFEDIKSYAKKHADVVIFCGDLFDKKFKVDTQVYVETLAAWRDFCSVPVYIIAGNHDQYSREGSNSLLPFHDTRARNTALVSQPENICLDDAINVLLIPHQHDTNKFKQILKDAPSADILVMHQGLAEAVTGAYNVQIQSAIKLADIPFDKFKWVVSGHYHKAQVLAGGKFRYCGSPLQLSMGERGEEKGFWVLDTDKDTWEFVKTNAPQFYLHESSKAFKECADKKGYHRVKCQVEEAEKLKKEFPNLQIEILKAEVYEERRVDPKKIQKDEDLLEVYISENNASLDPESLIQLGLELLNGE